MTELPGLIHATLFVGLNGLILFWLTFHTVRTRIRLRISVGDGGNPDMLRAMRGQANFIEMVPFCLILLVSMAILGAPAWLIWIFGVPLTIGRVLHGWHFSRPGSPVLLRQIGTLATWWVLLIGALGVSAHALTKVLAA